MTTPKDRKKRPSRRKEAAPDDPIYTRGFVVGGYYGRRRKPEEAKRPDPSHPAKEQYATREEWSKVADDDDFIGADMALGMYDQCGANVTRHNLIEYAVRNGYAWALRRFLERCGWIDDDWRRRLEALGPGGSHGQG